jgi:glycosyltransferase involved in cell wall biosynthesis
VVDNSSSDGSAAVAQSFNFVTLLFEPRPGSYCARNKGLAAARGKYIAFIDSDCIATPGWLEAALAQATREDKLGVVAGRIDLFCEDGQEGSVAANYETLFAFNQKKNAALGVSVTANWTSRRDVLLTHGGFADHMKSGGDTELSRRITGNGYRIVYAHDATVKHPVRGTNTALFARTRRVLGGTWSMSSRPRPLRFLVLQYAFTRESFYRMMRVARERSPGNVGRLRMMSFILVLWVIGTVELLVLFLGSEPRRS